MILDTQKTVTSLFLSHMGYCHHMPWSVVYAPESVRGLGLQHLGNEQGVQQVMHLIQHLHANTTNGKLYQYTIDSYQLHLGIQQPILENTQTILWMEHGWLTSIHQFLNYTCSSIQLRDLWIPPSCHCNDQCIMEDV